VTFLLLVVGATAAALGTRMAAFAFVAAAVAGATGDAAIAPVATWSAAIAAGWLVLTNESPRRIALPAFGLAAVLAAGSVPNGAVVLGLWVVATCAAVISRGDGPYSGAWALSLCGLDLALIVCIASTATRGFEGWPETLTAPGAIALVGTAAARALLAAGSDDETALVGLVLVRAQAVVGATFAFAIARPRVSESAVVFAAVAFAAAPALRRRAMTDALQEFALVAMALASSSLGWGPDGWEWGALAAGTLIHYLRFTVRRTRSAPFARALATSTGVGVPFLPVVLAQLEGAAHAPRVLAAAVLIGLLAGLAGRARASLPVPRRTATAIDEVRAGVAVAMACVAGLVTVLFTFPRPPAADAVPAPAVWAAAVVLAVGAVGARLVRVVGAGRREPVSFRWPRAIAESAHVATRVATDRVLWAAMATLAAFAAVMWIVGASRGFL
jgi:hypothetical protein